MAENKTKPSSQSVTDFLAGVDEQKRRDSLELIEMMREISGHEPVLWGPSIIGFDTYHYKYPSGHEGDMCALGFSPRKANLTIYITDGFNAYGELMSRLGKHTTSVACLYIKKLADVDKDVLKELITQSYQQTKATPAAPSPDVDAYEATLPETVVPAFKTLRQLVRDTMPQAEECISYGIPAYRLGPSRAVVFISGWKDHLAMYPIPKDETLYNALKPYIKGKGTLWFPLATPLPRHLIERIIRAHVSEYEIRRAHGR